MRIGIPKETKVLEGRIGLIPEACSDLVAQGHQVFVQKGGGLLSGYTDAQYQAVGVQITEQAAELFDTAEMIVKVKEPCGPELDLLKRIIYCFVIYTLPRMQNWLKACRKRGYWRSHLKQ